MTHLVVCSDSYCKNENKLFVRMDCYKLPLSNAANKSTYHTYMQKKVWSYNMTCYMRTVNITFHKVH